jgi:hypothetical protein
MAGQAKSGISLESSRDLIELAAAQTPTAGDNGNAATRTD